MRRAYCETVKNVTVSLDDATYRRARLRASELDTSLSALVRDYLTRLGSEETEFERLKRLEQEVRAQLKSRGTGFSAADNLSRDDLHDRARARQEMSGPDIG